MFKEKFPDNFKAYSAACEQGEVKVGKMFVTENLAMFGPRWIINFPTKQHWRSKTKMAWIDAGLVDLVHVIDTYQIHSIAVPPLGCGNGGLSWGDVKPRIEAALESVDAKEFRALVYEPTGKYQNVAKREGVEKLTPARALISHAIREYCRVDSECTILEVQKLAWFTERALRALGLKNPLELKFEANKFGPYSKNLGHLLNALDGSYIHSEKRLADAGPFDVLWFEHSKADRLDAYLISSEFKPYAPAIEWASKAIHGFQSPFDMELLATVDWLLTVENVAPDVKSLRTGLERWPAETSARKRKLELFDERVIGIALEHLQSLPQSSTIQLQ